MYDVKFAAIPHADADPSTLPCCSALLARLACLSPPLLPLPPLDCVWVGLGWVGSTQDKRIAMVVTTEMAARGLDVAHLTHVVNYDLPTDADHYVHRAGR